MNDNNKNSTLPLVTVITSVYNEANNIEKSIQSVKNQVYPNIEYIVIDGGSTDGTLNIIKEKSHLIDFYISEPDQGIYDAWNKGLKIAKGEYICFLGADDFFYPNAIEDMMNVAVNSERKLDYISGRTDLFFRSKYVKTIGLPWEWKYFRNYCCTAQNAALHNRCLYKDYGLYDIKYSSSGDYEFLLRVGKKLKAGYTSSSIVYMNLGGISNSSLKAVWETQRAIIKHVHPSKLKSLKLISRALISWYVHQLFNFIKIRL